MAIQKLIVQNIRGVPLMRYKYVLHDLKVLKRRNPTVLALQEMKAKYYWTALLFVFNPINWGSYPKAFMNDKSSQPIIWKRSALKCLAKEVRLLHEGRAGQTEDRYMRAVRLQEKDSRFTFWLKNTHYLPRGAASYDEVWPIANKRDREFTKQLLRYGDAVICVGDYNAQGEVLGKILFGQNVDYNGMLDSIDKIMTINGLHWEIVELTEGAIPASGPNDVLHTDHAGRTVTFKGRPKN